MIKIVKNQRTTTDGCSHGVSYENSLILEHFGISDIFFIICLMYQHGSKKGTLKILKFQPIKE